MRIRPRRLPRAHSDGPHVIKPLALLSAPLFLMGCLMPDALTGPSSDASIIAFGDSYTEGHGARSEEAYPARLSRELGREVLNKGVTGETAGEALRRLERDVLRHDPDIVIVQFGVNEAYRGLPVERSLADIETMVSRIREETNASIVLVGVHFWGFQTNFDDGLREIAARHDAGVVTDVLDGIVSSQRDVDDGDPTLRSDRYHPNARGYALVAERILPALQAKIAPPPAP